MSTTVSIYLSNISPTAPEYPLAQNILSKIALAASTTNPAHANGAKAELSSLVGQMLDSLIDNKRVSPATVLALMASAASGRTVPDTGVLGSVTVSGGVINITPGAY